eukprot:gene4144-8111_t
MCGYSNSIGSLQSSRVGVRDDPCGQSVIDRYFD